MTGKGSTYFVAAVFVICCSSAGTADAQPQGMDFATIPEGSFVMGAPSSEYEWDEDEKQHRVSISAFELMTTEVTQGIWREIMGGNPALCHGNADEYPVYYVSWNDCQDFIENLNDMDPNYTYRLPTEAEWEYACRAETSSQFYWGDSFSSSTIELYGWCRGYNIHPVATKRPNAWGIYDMIGNVWEFCQDVYIDDYDNCPSDGSAYTGPGSRRVIRGGSYRVYVSRSANRNRISPGYRLPVVGFRLARSSR